MKKFIAGAALAATALSLNAEVVLADRGRTEYTIIYDLDQKDALLDPAVRDLAATLGEITGAEFPIRKSADGPKIFVGVTPSGEKDEFEPRERRIKTVGSDLYIYGDRRYGTAGAIYNFLAEFCNCRWYTATGDKRIPKNPELRFADIDYRHVPSFKSIEHGSRMATAVMNPEIRDWVRRNNSFLMPNYAFGEADDAWNYIGPVTHTLAAYMPPIRRKPRSFNDDNTFFAGPHPVLADHEYFKTNPEYFTLNANGVRVKDMQLCFSDPTVRRVLLENIEKVIRAEKYDPETYAILDFTQNDRSGGFCYCEKCQALNRKYGTPGGTYFDFLVEMGKHFAAKYPKLTFRFFSYQQRMTGIPPKGLKFPDNMSVIIAPLEQDFSKPFSDRYNVRFLNQMRQWKPLCREIWIWNYPTLYTHGMNIYSLFPGVYRNTENLKLAHDAGVRYIIAEQGGSVVHGCSFKELNCYLQTRMAEHVDIDVDAVIKEFCMAVYGSAASDIIAYLKDADAQCRRDPGYFRYYYDPRVMRRVLHSPANLIRWQRDFDRMEAKVKDEPRALFNVRRARINLDAVTLLCYRKCAESDAKFAAELPIDKLYRRYCKIVRDDAKIEFRSFPDRKAENAHVKSFIDPVRMAYEFNRREQRFPEELVAKYGRKNLYSLMPCPSRRPPDAWDKDSASGYVVRIPSPSPEDALWSNHIDVSEQGGLPWNDVRQHKMRKRFLTENDLKRIEGSDDWQLVFVGSDTLSPSGYIQLATLPVRNVRFFLGECFNPERPKRRFDFYLSVRRAGNKKDLLIDRLVLAGKPERTPTPHVSGDRAERP